MVINGFTYLNNGQMVKNCSSKMEMKEGDAFKLPHFHLKLMGWVT